jgi:3-oxoacyl-[acyl-carrier-protein] synthase III
VLKEVMDHAYIVSAAAFFPGAPVSNEEIDRFVAPIDEKCARIKRRILAENGIMSRHYALDANGRTTHSVSAMAVRALKSALVGCDFDEGDPSLDFLAAATSGPDASLPGFANMVQGEARLPPMKTASLSGVCASSVSALDYAVQEVRTGRARRAAVVASEFPSRLFKRSRMKQAKSLTFDAHFLRWMLSDGAGAWILANRPASQRSLRVDFVHLRSFSGDYPTCMQVGHGHGNDGPGYLDFDSLKEAEESGAYLLRQDIRLLPNLFDVGVHEYSDLVRRGLIDPGGVDHFLGHYSSNRFRGVVRDLMAKAGLLIPEQRWYSNLTLRGNMGSASIITMLADFLNERDVKAGERLLLFVPESGRFTVGFVGLTVVDGDCPNPANRSAVALNSTPPTPAAPMQFVVDIPAPVESHENPRVARVLQDLLHVWHTYRSGVLRSPVAGHVVAGTLTAENYRAWMAGWIGQVREGAAWMRIAAANLPEHLRSLGELIERHAGEEQNDWRVLHADYVAAGGTHTNPDDLRRNPGAEALNAYMHRMASSSQAEALLGAVYIIEGTGNRIVPALLPRIRQLLGEGLGAYRFLEYHGENDVAHMQRWLTAVEMAVTSDVAAGERILNAAADVAALYAMSWAHALDPQH